MHIFSILCSTLSRFLKIYLLISVAIATEIADTSLMVFPTLKVLLIYACSPLAVLLDIVFRTKSDEEFDKLLKNDFLPTLAWLMISQFICFFAFICCESYL